MIETIGKTRQLCAVLVLVGVLVGCSNQAQKGAGAIAVRSDGLNTPNSLFGNGLASNGIWYNGIWYNGIWYNGIWYNGIWYNGIWYNGLSTDLWAESTWSDILAGDDRVPGDALRSNGYLRQLLTYMYSCAMPPTTYDKNLDPNNGALTCVAQSDCDFGYSCSGGLCVVPLEGRGGLAINRDGSDWWSSGTCDDSCQRWVTACLLARTNAYGEHVQISLRAPDDAPPGQELQFARIRATLATGEAERSACPEGSEDDPSCGFTMREGAYYGNLFQGTPGTVGADKKVVPNWISLKTKTGTSLGTYDASHHFVPGIPAHSDGPADVVVRAPTFSACAGPASNVPAITRRFVSSQGAQVGINVSGMCVADAANPLAPAACAGLDGTPEGAIRDCFTNTDPMQRSSADEYHEVLTVYLKKPIATCGNSVCEEGEDTPTAPLCSETSTRPCYCPSDCPPAWAKSISPNIAGTFTEDNWSSSLIRPQYDLSAVGPDDSVAVAGTSTTDVDLGGVVAAAGDGIGVLAKFNVDGSHAWTTRFGSNSPTASGGQLTQVTGVAVAPTGDITVVGTATEIVGAESYLDIWIGTFARGDGALINQHSLRVGLASAVSFSPTTPVAVDSQGNVIMGGTYSGSSSFGSCHNVGSNPCSYFAKVAPDGSLPWSRTTQGVGNGDFPASVSVDAQGNFVTLDPYFALTKWRANGTMAWQVTPPPENTVYGDVDGNSGSPVIPWRGAQATGIDSLGNVYLAGNGDGFGAPNVSGYKPALIKYASSNGTFVWSAKTPLQTCGQGCMGGATELHNRGIAFTQSGDVIVGSVGHAYPGGGVDFSGSSTSPLGTLDTYGAVNIFVVGYSASGTPIWSQQLPATPTSGLLSLAIDHHARVVISGTYSGSVVIGNRLITSTVPEDPSILSSFLGSFSTPSSDDHNPPVFGTWIDSLGHSVSTVPTSINVQATSAEGTNVIYTPPTALDAEGSGAHVSCFPVPSTMFPLGPTTVTCTTFDPRGNISAAASFTVTVQDTLAPVILPVHDVTATATGPNGAIVTYTPPAAADQVEGTRDVTCTPPSGAEFAVGTTTVECKASDSAGNTASKTFSVIVTQAGPTVSVTCLGTPAAPVSVSTAPGMCGAPVSAGAVGSCAGGTSALASCTLDGVATETLGPGDHAVALLATGLDGSMAGCTAYVSVVDGEKPVATCANQTVACTGGGGATVTPVATCADNCSCTTSCTTVRFPVGATSGSCTAKDPAGNTAVCQPTITVVDAVGPVVTPRTGPTQLQCNVDKWTDPGATAQDQCVGDVSGTVRVSGAVDPTRVGKYTETYTASDPSGNTGVASRSVSVIDSLPPATTATVGASGTPTRWVTFAVTSYTVTPTGGGAPITGNATCWSTAGVAVSLKATDGCALKQLTYALTGAQTGGATVSGGSASFAVTRAGNTMVSYYATDSAGNAEATKRLPVFVANLLGVGFSCAPSPSLSGLPPHGTVSLKGTVTVTDSKTNKTKSQSFSFVFSY